MWIFVLDFGLFKLLDSSVISDSVTIVADDEEVTNWFWFRLTGFILIGDFDFEFDRVLDLDVFLLCFLYFDDFDFFLLDFLLRVSVDELLNIGIIINILI
jgi:catechol 2,3-dioxygenase-like lactoylglutathione lyase family enzyme